MSQKAKYDMLSSCGKETRGTLELSYKSNQVYQRVCIGVKWFFHAIDNVDPSASVTDNLMSS